LFAVFSNDVMNKQKLIFFFFILLSSVLFISCVDMPSSHEIHLVDSLNVQAFRLRYIDSHASAKVALLAYHSCVKYERGRAEACNNLAFCNYIWMNFDMAERLYKKVHTITKNQTELLVSDIGLMKIYQRTAMNEAFYEMRNEARRHIKRIDQDPYLNMSPHETLRVKFAKSEFYIVSAIYYYYLRQHDEANEAMDSVSNNLLKADPSQLLYFKYVKGWSYFCRGTLHDDQKMECFDVLYDTWETSKRLKVIYFEANSLQSLSDLFATNETYNYFKERRGYLLSNIYSPVDSLYPLRLADLSLKMFLKFQDPYQFTSSYVSIAQYYNLHGQYKEALNILSDAMECVNSHHKAFYPSSDSTTLLRTYIPNDTINREIKWVSNSKSKTVPEWISEIREQLSVAYAGLNNKPASDYNRNAYLDILNYTRQDKELENRYNTLQAELDNLNMVFIITLIIAVIVVFLLWFFNRRAHERDVVHTARLRDTLALCQKITTYSSEQAEAKLEELNNAHFHNKEDKAMAKVMIPYLTWVIDNRKALSSLSEEHNRLDKERYLSEEHIIENKKQNITKKACLSIVNGINPYIDRILNEVRKLQSSDINKDSSIYKERLQYIDELVSTINDYNDILTQWIKVKQGAISLNIQNFELNELFSWSRRAGVRSR
jgi:hypothetical protein